MGTGSRFVGALLAVMLALVPSAPAAEAADAGGIAGTVTDEMTGLPIPDLMVIAYWFCPVTGSHPTATFTDAAGRYSFDNLTRTENEYFVRFVGEFDGYQTEWYDDQLETVPYTLPGGATGFTIVLGSVIGGVDAALAPLGSPPKSGKVIRLSGTDRYATSVAISERFYGSGVDAVYLARGDDFPDGLAGAPPAGQEVQGPILLTQRDALPQVVRDELVRLAPKQIFILGGPGVVSESVATQAAGYTTGAVTRLFGSNRYETATAISDRFYASVYNGNRAVCVARGDAFPDALAGGPMCSMEGGPMLLTPTDGIPASVMHQIESLQVTGNYYILGGTGAVSTAVEQQLVQLVNPGATSDPRVVRLAGSNRYATAAAVYQARAGMWSGAAFIAVGTNFPDALSGGAPAGMMNAPILLVETGQIPAATATALTDLQPSLIYILGGPGAVSPQVALQLEAFIAP